jgi:hypothetical protein
MGHPVAQRHCLALQFGNRIVQQASSCCADTLPLVAQTSVCAGSQGAIRDGGERLELPLA